MRHFQDNPAFLPAFVLDRINFDWGVDSRFSPQLAEAYESERVRLGITLTRMVEMGRIRCLDIEFLTGLCMDIVQASLHFTHHHCDHEDVAACVDRALDVFLNGVGGRP